MFQIRNYSLQEFEHLVGHYGQDARQILLEAGLSLAALRSSGALISYPKLALILELAAAQCREPWFGLRLAERHTLDVLAPIPLIAAQYKTVAEALSGASQSLTLLVSGGIDLAIFPHQGKYHLSMQWGVSSPRGTWQLQQLSMGHLVMFVAALLGRPRDEINLYLTLPRASAIQIKDMPLNHVHFGASFNGVMLHEADMLLANKLYAPALRQHIDHYLQFLRAQMPLTLEDEVKEMIRVFLPSFESSIEVVANALDLHPRNLQLKLKQRGTTYSTLLQEVRHQLAIEHLNRPKTSVTELALQLGYSDIAAFSRSFKRWTGVSPSQWQQRNALNNDAVGRSDNSQGETHGSI